MAPQGPAARAAIASASVVFLTGVLAFSVAKPGPLSTQMAQHLFVMNVLAPVVAVAWLRRTSGDGRNHLWLAVVAQLALLYAWHAPSAQLALSSSAALHAVFLLTLAASALVFWIAVLRDGAAGRWRVLAALLITGKVACLTGALLIFAPRDLYALRGIALTICATGPSSLADQQFAGLLMITACPLSYIVAGIVLAARMLAQVDAEHVAREPSLA